MSKPKNDLLILSLASGQSVREAANAAGVSEKTVRRRLADAEFRRRIDETRAELFQLALSRLAAAAARAASTLEALLDGKRETSRLRAARSILELGTRLRETVELETRLLALEQNLQAKDKQ